MDFEFTDEQRMLRETYRKFCEAELTPEYVRWMDENCNWVPDEMLAKMADLGTFAITIPEGSANIKIVLRPFAHPKLKPYTMQIKIDDVVLSTHVLQNDWQEIITAIPEQKADDRIHVLTFHFDPPPTYSPARLGLWDDFRTLAGEFRKIEIQPR